MDTHIKGDKLVISEELEPKQFKTKKQGWYLQKVVEINGQKVRLNLLAYKIEKKEKR